MKKKVIAALAALLLLAGCTDGAPEKSPSSSEEATTIATVEPQAPTADVASTPTRENGTPYMWASKMAFPTADLRIAIKTWAGECAPARPSDECNKVLTEIESGANNLGAELANNFGYAAPTGVIADLHASTVANAKTLEESALATLEECLSADCATQTGRLSAAATEFLDLDEQWRSHLDSPETPAEPPAPSGLAAEVEAAFNSSYGSGGDATYPVILGFTDRDAPRVTVAVDMHPKAENEPEALGMCRAVLSIRDQVTSPFRGVYVTASEGGPLLAECDNPDY